MPNAGDFLQVDSNILKCYGDQNVVEILNKLSEPDQTIFVFNHAEQFVGALSPYDLIHCDKHCIHQQVSQIMIRPPYISPNTSLTDIAALMYSTHTFSLPVQSNDHVVGVININNLRRYLSNSPYARQLIGRSIRIREAASIDEEEKTISFIAKMKTHTLSWTVIVNQYNEPLGLLHNGHLLELIATEYPNFEPKKAKWIKYKHCRDISRHPELSIKQTFNYYPAPQIPETDTRTIMQTILKPGIHAVITTSQGKYTGIISIRQLCESFTPNSSFATDSYSSLSVSNMGNQYFGS